MTTPLFPDRPTDAPADVDEHPGPLGRWALHRAGLLNVWQYDRVELAFAGGRMLLRGKNGAGKSKALEVLLPFLLDGDTRSLDATGRDRTTVTWLMTDGRPAGNHVGYVWLELRCLDDDGAATFLTLGAGLKASSATRRSDCWFFVTDRRVGIDVELDVAGECLSIERLKAAVGEEAVTPSGAEHRRRVGRHVFGLFDDARYRNVLHLLHRLRDPNIGNRVEAGELATVLTDALPPIDDRVLTEAAGHFDDLDTIKRQVDRAATTAEALGQFLGAYRGYTRTVLGRRAAAVTEAEAHRARAGREVRRRTTAAEQATQAAANARAALEKLRAERRRGEAERGELERSDAYRAHQDLTDRQGRVDALDAAAAAAEGAAARADQAHRRAVDDLDAAIAELDRAVRAARETAASVAALAVDAGLDAGLVGPGVDERDLAGAEARLRAARTLVEARRRRAAEVRVLAQQAEAADRDATAAEARAAESEREVDGQREVVAAARAALESAAQAWSDAVVAWTGSANATADWSPVLDRAAARDGSAAWTADVRQAVAEALAPAVGSARAAAAKAEVDVAAALAEVDEASRRLADVEAEEGARPLPGRYLDAARDPAAGAALYELVDLAPDVGPAAAAGIEAALEASGLLDAWVHADGLVVHPDTHDVLLSAAAPAAGSTLADVLAVVAAPGSPVSSTTVNSVLRAVGLGERDGDAAWVTTGGRWRLGVLRGAWHKEEVEYLGAAARRATRERLLAELRAELKRCEQQLAAARAGARGAARHLEALEALPATLPGDEGVEAASGELAAAEWVLASARGRFDDDRRAAERLRAVAGRAMAAVTQEAAADALPTAVADLDGAIDGLGALRDAVLDLGRQLADVAGADERTQQRRADETARSSEAVEAAAAARAPREEHGLAAHELAVLRRALGDAPEAVMARHHEVVRRLAELDDRGIPAAEKARSAAERAEATAAVQLEQTTAGEGEAVGALAVAGSALAVAVRLPGVVLAATGRDAGDVVAGAGDDPIALAGRLLAEVDGSNEVSDGTILSRYDRLSEALAGGFDTAIDEQDGVKVVHVADETGRQPLAVVAARLTEEADAARARLASREREVLERFLLRELADEVRSKLLDAHDHVTGTNRTLAAVRTSHGKGAHLEWRLRDDTAGPAPVAARLLVDGLRDEAADAELRDALLAVIDAERAADPSAGYEQHLRAALDYRAWHRFTVKVTDATQPGTARTLSSRLGLSQGEQRVISYLALFAAAAAHFEAIGRDTPTAPRLLLLDDAFAKVDEPTHGELLGLLVHLGLDFVLTSERMWGCFGSVPSLEIYEAVRDPAHRGVALVHFHWDGRQRHLVGV